MRAVSYLISFFFYLYFILSSALLWLGAVAIFLVTVPFDHRRRWLHAYSCAWAYHYILLCPFWQASFSGREHIRSGHAYVIAANHQSWIDIPLLFGLFTHFKWVSKREMFRVPFLGWNMTMNGYVPLARGKQSSIVKMMRHCERHLESGSSVLIFPEGTRSPDGEIHAFKAGAVSIRLPDEELEAFIKKYKTKQSEQHGRVMKEYALVPDALLKKTQEMKKYFTMSFDYIGTLKPKPTKNKASKKAKG